MKHWMIIGLSFLAGLLMASTAAQAQLPGGMQMPGGLGLPSKDTLLKQAQELVLDLTSMKDSSKLTPPQAKQAADLLPKAQSLTGELEKPQLDAARLPQLAGDLSTLQKQVGVLKGFMK